MPSGRRVGLLITMVAGGGAPLWAADGAVSFDRDVRPVLRAMCYDCHGDNEKPEGQLDLRLARFLLKGGESGPAVAAGKPDDSLLLQRVRDGEMPPGKKKLTPAQIDTIARWIAAGAGTDKPEPAAVGAGMMIITDDDRNWWAFQPIRRPAAPEVRSPKSQVRNAIDSFLLAALQAKGLSLSPQADRRTLIRRASIDLIGLPPTPAEVQTFADDRAPDAWERLIDRLLADPRYGERWGRHWLDVAGYADSEGYSQADPVRTEAWKYRDYVVRAFNADKPLDRFIREQLAGDEMIRPPYPALKPEDVDKLVATGFLRMASDGTAAAPAEEQKGARNAVVADTIKIVSSAFLGLTVGCAQCHNHRYDPIPQADYYRLRAVFEPALDVKNWKTPPGRQISLLSAADRVRARDIDARASAIDKERLRKTEAAIDATLAKQLEKVPAEERDKARTAAKVAESRRSGPQKELIRRHPFLNVTAGSLYLYDRKAADELKKMTDEAAALRATKPVEEFVRALTEVPGQVPVTAVFHRGDPDQPRQKVEPGALSVVEERLPIKPPAKTASGGTGRRTALAEWLTDRRHPLTARVLINRVWMHHFGRGLVGTPGDFGRLGEPPTHPALLDWLADELTAGGWTLKRMHRLIMTSAAYQQSSASGDPHPQTVDPDNRLLWRMPLRRFEAEVVRDAALAVAGRLTPRLFGRPVPVRENEVGQVVLGIDNRDGAGRFVAERPLPPGDEFRRSLYVQARRSRPLAMLDAFDWAVPEPNCEARNSSTQTPQALMLMNGDFTARQADAFAERLEREAGTNGDARVILAWQLAFAAEPTESERGAALAFVAAQAARFRAAPASPTAPATKAAKPVEPVSPERRAWALFCQALLSSNRFLYVE